MTLRGLSHGIHGGTIYGDGQFRGWSWHSAVSMPRLVSEKAPVFAKSDQSALLFKFSLGVFLLALHLLNLMPQLCL